MMVAAQVIGNDACVAFSGSQGNLELNVMMPVMARNVLESARLLANVSRLLADKVVDGAEADVERAREYAESSPSVVTPLNSYIGYEEAAVDRQAGAQGAQDDPRGGAGAGARGRREADRRAARRGAGRAGHGPRRPPLTGVSGGRTVGARCEDAGMLLAEVVATSAAVGATRSRKAKVAALAALLRAAAPEEIEPATAWLAGEPRQGRIGAGWRTLAGLDAAPAGAPSLQVGAVDARWTSWPARPGAGSTARRAALLGRAVRRGHRRRAGVPAPAAHRRAAPGRAGGGDAGGHRGRRGAPAGRGPPGVHALRAAAAHRPARADRRRRGARRGDAAGRGAGAADARLPGRHPGRRAGRPGRRGQRRVQAGRRPDPGAPRRRRGAGVDPHPARDHRERAGAGRAGARRCRAGRWCWTGRPWRCATTAGRARSRRR